MMHSSRGFTLIEIVSVLIVLGVLAFVTASAFMSNDATGAFVERDKLRSSLIHARAQGMAMGGGQCVSITTDEISFSTLQSASMPSQLKTYAFSVQATGSAEFCFDAAGSVCTNPVSREDTGILYCPSDKDSSASLSVAFGSGATLTLFSATGFTQ